MNTREKNPVLMIEEDYRLIKRYLPYASQDSQGLLAQELDRAIILHKHAFPHHAIRLNSHVSVLDETSGEVLSFTIVAPGCADSAQRKLSVLNWLATAVIGFRKGEEVQCPIAGGIKTFRITEVVNAAACFVNNPNKYSAYGTHDA